MARNDDSKRDANQGGAPASRVFKSKDVHKRRVNAKAKASTQDAPAVKQPPCDEEDAKASTGGISIPGAIQVPSPSEPSAENAPLDTKTAFFADSETGQISDGVVPVEPRDQDGKSAVAPLDAAIGEEQGEDASGETPQPTKAKLPKLKVTPKRVLFVLVGIVLIAAVGFCSVFAWNRWGRYDDHADMQGQWYVAGTTVPVTIDENSIRLTDEVSYTYTIDDHDKMIRYTFGPMEGQGRYWFSDDRGFLAITDGEGFTGVGNTFDDLVHSFVGFSSANGASGAKLPEGDGVIVFCREPGILAQMAKEAAERALQRAEAQKAEEAKKKEAAEKAAEEQAAKEELESDAQTDGAGASAASDEFYYVDDGVYVDNGTDEDEAGVVEGGDEADSEAGDGTPAEEEAGDE